MRLRTALLAVALLAATLAGTSAPVGAAPVPPGAVWEEVFFPSLDGTMLHGDLLTPADGCPEGGCPVIVSIGPYFGSGVQSYPLWSATNSGPSNRFYDFITHDFPGRGNIFAQGYAWLQVDSRGYGSSGGCNDFGGIGEQMDAAAAVTWAGSQDWSNGNVGMWGKSYDAWTQVMALAMNPPHLEAVVIQAPLIEAYGGFYVNGVHNSLGWYLTPSLYMLYDLIPPSVTESSPEEFAYPAVGTATDPCWAENQAIAAAGWDHDLAYWQERYLAPRASRNDDVAVLWSHGFNDVNTKPNQIFEVYEPLNHRPDANVRGWFGQWAHDRGNEANHVGRDGFLEEALDWFDHYLKGLPFRYTANEHNVVEVQDNEGVWRTEASYPPADIQWTSLPLRDGAYTDNASSSANTGYWTFSQPLEHDLRVAGEPTLEVTADIAGPYANLIGVLYDYDPSTGRATELSRGAYRLEGDGTVSFRLFPRDHIFRAGHRIAFQVSAGHQQFFPHPTNTTVQVTDASVTVPFLTYERVSNLTGDPSSRSSYSKSPSAGTVTASELEMPLPGPMIPYPDDATREAIQPTVTTPAG